MFAAVRRAYFYAKARWKIPVGQTRRQCSNTRVRDSEQSSVCRALQGQTALLKGLTSRFRQSPVIDTGGGSVGMDCQDSCNMFATSVSHSVHKARMDEGTGNLLGTYSGK